MPANGRLPLSSLVKVDGWAYLVRNTATAWTGACDEMVALGYPRPMITAPDGAYRDLLRQIYWKAYWTARGKPENAATPGYSNHGWGIDVDIWNVAIFPRKILVEVFARWGFTFNVPWELWHIHHDGTAPAGGGSTPIGDEMTPEQDQMLRSIYRALFEIPVDDFAKRPNGLGRAIKDSRDALFLKVPTSFGTPAGVLGTLRTITDKLGITKP